jgi:hypothetical protein
MLYSGIMTATNIDGPAALVTPWTSHERVSSVDLQSTTKTFYVYVLARPDGSPFYVGKGLGKRIFDHDYEARSGHKCHKCNIIRKIWKSGGEVQRYIVFETNDEQEAFAYEIELIALHGRNNLANLTDGGEGQRGAVRSGLALERQRAQMIARYSDPNERDKQRERITRAYENPEARQRVSDGLKAMRADPDKWEQYSEKLSVVSKARWSDPEARARIITGIRSAFQRPDIRERKSQTQKERREKEYRARICPEQEEEIRQLYATGEYTYRTLGAKYGLWHGRIRRILFPNEEAE